MELPGLDQHESSANVLDACVWYQQSRKSPSFYGYSSNSRPTSTGLPALPQEVIAAA